jgi:hypothetical protein
MSFNFYDTSHGRLIFWWKIGGNLSTKCSYPGGTEVEYERA